MDPWDAYAPFYDWENARTMQWRDLAEWRRVLARERPPVLELGCGTGRLLIPLAKLGVQIVGVDRSPAMLDRARRRVLKLPRRKRPLLALGDIRSLPFASSSFGVVMAPYGMVQSLLTDRDLHAMLRESARVLRRAGLLGVYVLLEMPNWESYRAQERLKGHTASGAAVRLIESVKQDRRRRLTTFREIYEVSRGGRRKRRRFTIQFRTLTTEQMSRRLATAGFQIESIRRLAKDDCFVLARRTKRAPASES